MFFSDAEFFSGYSPTIRTVIRFPANMIPFRFISIRSVNFPSIVNSVVRSRLRIFPMFRLCRPQVLRMIPTSGRYGHSSGCRQGRVIKLRVIASLPSGFRVRSQSRNTVRIYRVFRLPDALPGAFFQAAKFMTFRRRQRAG